MNANVTRRYALLAVVASVVGIGPSVLGQGRTWNGNGANNNWSTAANWSTNTVPPLTATTEIWAFGSTANQLATEMDNAYTIARVQFSGTSGHSINSAASNTLTLVGTANNQVMNALTGMTATVNVPIVLGTGGPATTLRTIDTAGTAQLTINGSINAGTFDFSKIGTGTLTLTNSNSFSGYFDIANGIVRVDSVAALGSASIRNSSGNNIQLLANTATPLNIPNAINLTIGTGALTFTATGGPNATLSGPISTSGIRPIGVAAGTTLTIDGLISGTGGISKNVEGTMIVNGDNANTGGFTLTNGTVQAGHDNAFGLGGPFTHNSGNNVILTSTGGARTFNNPVVLGSLGTLQFGTSSLNGNITFNGMARLTSLNANATPGDLDDLKPITVATGMTATLAGGINDEPAGGGASLGYGLSKAGPGTLALGGAITYTGATSVSGGTLMINGTHTNAGGYTITTNGRLGGSGSTSAAVNLQGKVAPGDGIGTLAVGSVTFDPTATMETEIASSSSFDKLVVSGAASVAGSMTIDLLGSYEPAHSDTFAVLTSTGLTGTFGNLNAWGLVTVTGGGKAFLPEYTATDVVLKEFTKVGDVNFDNTINNQDIAPFVAVLTGGPVVPPSSLGFAADVNGDGVVNNQDIAPFVALLTGSRPLGDVAGDPEFAPLIALVPEPASLSLLALGGLALRRRRVA